MLIVLMLNIYLQVTKFRVNLCVNPEISYLERAGVMPQIVIIVFKVDSNFEIVFHNDVVNALP